MNSNSKPSVFAACLTSKSDRFTIMADGKVWMELLGKSPVPCPDVDVSPFLEEIKKAGANAKVMVDHLVPNEFSGEWRLGMQTSPQALGHATFTPYKQHRPELSI